ncbi:MAG: hypothetical protein ABJP48_01710 [Erythrobacter sp.]
MGDANMDISAPSAIEAILKDELKRGDLALNGVAPVLTHMLANSGGSLVSEAIVARLRGMLADLARQLLQATGAVNAGSGKPPVDPDVQSDLADHLAGDSVVLSHCYALAMEGHLSERLERKVGLDPVMSPLVQELIASTNQEIAELAIAILAAQSRFVQSQKRMEMPLGELPAELFHSLMRRWESFPGQINVEDFEGVLEQLKSSYDEGASRVGLFARAISAMQKGARAALELELAGFALFVSALSGLTRQPRELAILSCHERQLARLALGLRTTGLNEQEIERQFEILHPGQMLPDGLDKLLPEQAQAILNKSDPRRTY